MYPDLETVQRLLGSGEYRRVPVAKEILSDRFTPIEVMRTLRAASRHCYLLESASQQEVWGRYSFLGYDPTTEITCLDGVITYRTTVDGEPEAVTSEPVSHPGEVLRRLIAENKSPVIEGLPTFTGGLVGYFSYDYIKYSEPKLKIGATDPGEGASVQNDFKDMDLMLFDKVIAFDHYRQKLVFITGVRLPDVPNADAKVENANTKAENSDIENADTAKAIAAAYSAAEAELDAMIALVRDGGKKEFEPLRIEGEIAPLFPKERYCEMVERAKHYIREGDIFQVVLSDPLVARASGSLFDTYRVLRATNPSPYMFYFASDDIELAGASPETLVRLEDGIASTFPLAGTCPRGRTPEEDAALEEELLADEKELSEHNMLVDLGRNDMGKISELGSVRVDSYMDVLRYSHVMHIGSTVVGKIRSDKDAVDAVDAILPAGTLSGAPKYRACEIIEELEHCKRGVYGGAIGYLDFTGNLDTCIAIRLVYKKNGRICIRSGAGIVADSVPEKEFDECQNKARAVVNAIREAQEGGL